MLTITTAATQFDLITLAATKTAFGITGSAEGTFLRDAITQASDVIARHCRRVFAQETIVETLRLDQSHNDIVLTRYPITEIASIVEGNTTVDPAMYEFNTESGVVRRLAGDGTSDGWWGATRITITYSAGYDLPTDVGRIEKGGHAVGQSLLRHGRPRPVVALARYSRRREFHRSPISSICLMTPRACSRHSEICGSLHDARPIMARRNRVRARRRRVPHASGRRPGTRSQNNCDQLDGSLGTVGRRSFLLITISFGIIGRLSTMARRARHNITTSAQGVAAQAETCRAAGRARQGADGRAPRGRRGDRQRRGADCLAWLRLPDRQRPFALSPGLLPAGRAVRR